MKQDFINKRFGRLTVVKERPDLKKENSSNRIVECLCDCGLFKIVFLCNLKQGLTKSCGCLQKESSVGTNRTHGLTNTQEYNTWTKIKYRCYNKNGEYYSHYGGRGITVCDEWLNSFETFYRDMGPRPSDKYSIDRKNNDKGYSKDNCRWATQKEQQNNKSNNILYIYKNETKSLLDWCTTLDLNFSIIYQRIKKGMLFEVAILINSVFKNNLLTLENSDKTLVEWCKDNNISFTLFKRRLYKGWTFKEALSDISSKQITFNPCADDKPPDTMSLEDWCGLLGLDKDVTYLRILRGESFETIVGE